MHRAQHEDRPDQAGPPRRGVQVRAGEIASIADEIDLPEGKAVIREGESGREFLVIVEEARTSTAAARSPRSGRATSPVRSH